jgi:hypothetical protein
MKLAVKRASTVVAAVATAGVSTLFLGVAPASAASAACGPNANLVTGNICEQVFTSGRSTFVPTAQMTKLEILLVGGGGQGNSSATPIPDNSPTGYATAGGGGQVRIVDFSAETASPIDVRVGAPDARTRVVSATNDRLEDATAGNDGGYTDGGRGGGGEFGSAQMTDSDPAIAYGAGGGGATVVQTPAVVPNAAVPNLRAAIAADPGAANGANGGAGVIVSTIAPAGSLFANDTNCYGGGGAVGVAGIMGLPGCGGAGPTDNTATALTVVTANSGGGGGAATTTSAIQSRGAAGLVVIRWNAPTVTLSFNASGHGTGSAPETVVVGTAPAKPADPTASGLVFKAWYTDAQLTTLADFSQPLSADTTFYAAFDPALAATGGVLNPAELALAFAALVSGGGLLAFAARRRRSANR